MTEPMRNTNASPLRADAARNVDRILDAAARLLGEDPSAGMGRIAAAADVGRATLYRHFPTREALFEALRARGYDEVRRAIAASRLDEGTASEALERTFVRLLEVSDRYRVFAAEERRAGRAAPTTGCAARSPRRWWRWWSAGSATGRSPPSFPWTGS